MVRRSGRKSSLSSQHFPWLWESRPKAKVEVLPSGNLEKGQNRGFWECGECALWIMKWKKVSLGGLPDASLTEGRKAVNVDRCKFELKPVKMEKESN